MEEVEDEEVHKMNVRPKLRASSKHIIDDGTSGDDEEIVDHIDQDVIENQINNIRYFLRMSQRTREIRIRHPVCPISGKERILVPRSNTRTGRKILGRFVYRWPY